MFNQTYLVYFYLMIRVHHHIMSGNTTRLWSCGGQLCAAAVTPAHSEMEDGCSSCPPSYSLFMWYPKLPTTQLAACSLTSSARLKKLDVFHGIKTLWVSAYFPFGEAYFCLCAFWLWLRETEICCIFAFVYFI